ncbi:MAG: DUF6894 family protein [Cypionkella sp.]
MATYYFDVHDGDGVFVDETGVELASMDAAIKEARRALADMVRDALREEVEQSLSIRIRDGAEGPVVLSVTTSTVTRGPNR